MASAFENRLRRTIEMAGTDGQTGPVPVTAIPSGSGLITGIAPSGTLAPNGALTLGTALAATFSNILLYLPAGAVASGAPGLYRVAMSSTTAGVVYDAQTGALIAGTGVAYTGVTAEVEVAQSKVSWGELVSGRPVRLKVQGICNNTAGAKTYRARLGSVSGTQINSAGPTSNKGFAPETCIQSVSSGIVLGGASGVTGGTNSAEIISVTDGQDVIVYHTIQLSTATDYAAIVSITQTTE